MTTPAPWTRRGALAAALAATLTAAGAAAQDPEATPNGRARYLGRDVAQTMHWTGAGWLLRATREEEENGAALQRWLAVRPGQSIADLGCGNGYHTLPLARAVGAAGVVHAVELQPQYLVMLQKRAVEAGLGNIVGVECTVDDPMLPPGGLDLVLMVDVYHELSHPVRVMQRVRESLRPQGRVVLVEFRAEDPEVPIKPEHTMTKAQMLREMASHSFRFAAETDELPWQHAMAFVPAGDDARLGARETVAGLLRARVRGDDRTAAPFLRDGETLEGLSMPDEGDEAPLELSAAGEGAVRARRGETTLRATIDADGRWFVGRDAPATKRPHGGARPFVAMHTATGGGSIDEQAALVGELGFDGLAWSLADLPVARAACERRGMDVASAYAVLTLPAAGADDDQTALAARLQPLHEAMQALAGGPGQLWLAVRHDGLAPRDPRGDASALAALRGLAARARATGVEVALYPHHDFWLETVDDARRVLAAIDDRRFGVCFNLCHHLRASDARDADAALRACVDRLFAVTLHGADVDGDDWPTLIRPLDEGDFGLAGLLTTLDAIGFDGPIGLQGFGIALPPREHLARSLVAWRAAHRQPAGQGR